MKLECLKDKLKNTIALAEKISGHNLSLPILSTVLLEAKKKSLIIRSTNLELGLEIEIPAKVDIEGLVAVSANVLVSYLNNLPQDDKISLELKSGNLHLVSKSSKTTIKALNSEDFPIIPKISQENGFEVETNLFLQGFQAVSFAAAVSDIKPEISSVYIYNNESELTFVATDSFRLAEKNIKTTNSLSNFSLIIPFKNLSELVRVLSSVEQDKIIVSYNKNQMAIQTDDLYLTLRIIDGVYPDYKQIIPTTFKTEFNIKKTDLINLLKLASIFSDRFNQIDLVIQKDKDLLEINSSNQDVGENKTEFNTKIKGENLEVSFNAKYLIDCLNSFSDEVVNLRFVDKNKPLVIEGVSDYTFRYLVMPVNK